MSTGNCDMAYNVFIAFITHERIRIIAAENAFRVAVNKRALYSPKSGMTIIAGISAPEKEPARSIPYSFPAASLSDEAAFAVLNRLPVTVPDKRTNKKMSGPVPKKRGDRTASPIVTNSR